MKTIEPNSDEDLINQYTATGIEAIQFSYSMAGGLNKSPLGTPVTEYEHVMETYKNCLRFLEKNIKERQLWN